MPFKIIETIERGRRLIATVPSLWESDGNLYWPKKNANKFKKIENSAPQCDWKLMPCILVRDNLIDYKTAEEEIALMSDATDTENKENRHVNRTTLDILNLNNLANDCIQLNKGTEEVSPAVVEDYSVIVAEDPSSLTTDAGHILIQDLAQVTSQENASNSEFDADVQNINISQPDKNLTIPDLEHLEPQVADVYSSVTPVGVAQQVGFLIELVSAVQENQKLLFDNQQKILKGLALINTKIEEVATRSQGTCQQEGRENSLRFKAITNIEELSNIEEQLNDPLMEKKYFEELSIICSDQKSGINNAYALVDTMFDREFLTHCSWGGGSKGDPKHCFKAFPKTIALFFKVVHESDKTFSKPICENFFKNVMRHSIKRNTAKRQRNSAMKNKTKKVKSPASESLT